MVLRYVASTTIDRPLEIVHGTIIHGVRAGFSVVDRGCCGIGRNRGMITCLPFLRPCLNRNTYIFWDAFHPTERVNVLLGRAAFNGGNDVVYPMNIQQLAAWQP